MKKLIELWKTNCEHCEAVKPVVLELEKEGYSFEKYNIESSEGEKIIDEYILDIDKNNKTMKYEQGFIYTPTFINPENREVLAFIDKSPSKEELLQLFQGGEVI